MKIQTHDTRAFFRYVLPAILSFSLSGVYSIVDGYFIGNRLGDIGRRGVRRESVPDFKKIGRAHV